MDDKEKIELTKWELALLYETQKELLLNGRREQWETEARVTILRNRLDFLSSMPPSDITITTKKVEA